MKFDYVRVNLDKIDYVVEEKYRTSCIATSTILRGLGGDV
jgi:hypothetical protein